MATKIRIVEQTSASELEKKVNLVIKSQHHILNAPKKVKDIKYYTYKGNEDEIVHSALIIFES